mmetsp:Transcript_1842/g.4643  ORF Transcript_1842/g.4643 Transcript_1842/m.4643 type:complete len:701 (+) Transcript_1842:194-2296(+)
MKPGRALAVACVLWGSVGVAAGAMVTIPLYGALTDQNYYYLHMSFGLNPATGQRWPSGGNNFSTCLFDTGSANLAVATPECCRRSGVTSAQECQGDYFPPSVCFDESNPYCTESGGVSVAYVQGSWTGTAYRGVVGFCGNALSAVCNLRSVVGFAAITQQTDFFDATFSCIVGMAYPAIARGGITPYFTQLVQDKMSQDVFATQFCFTPTAFTWTWATDGFYVDSAGQRVTVDTAGDGSSNASFIVWEDCDGCPPADVNEGTLNGAAVMWTSTPDQSYYTVTVTSMLVGGTRLDLDCGAYNAPAKSIVDSGTTVLALPANVFDAVVDMLAPQLAAATGHSVDAARDFLNSGSQSLKLEDWNFVSRCPQGTRSPDLAEIECASAGASVDCVLCVNLTQYNETLHAVARLPSISIGLMAENSSDYEFFVEVPPQQYLNQGDSVGWYDCLSETCESIGLGAWAFMVQKRSGNADSALTIGQTALHNLYVAFDQGHSRVGFAAAACPYAGLQTLAVEGNAVVNGPLLPQHRTANKVTAAQRRFELSSCASPSEKKKLTPLTIAMIAICTALGIAVVVLLAEWACRCRERRAQKRTFDVAQATPPTQRAVLEAEAWTRANAQRRPPHPPQRDLEGRGGAHTADYALELQPMRHGHSPTPEGRMVSAGGSSSTLPAPAATAALPDEHRSPPQGDGSKPTQEYQIYE